MLICRGSGRVDGRMLTCNDSHGQLCNPSAAERGQVHCSCGLKSACCGPKSLQTGDEGFGYNHPSPSVLQFPGQMAALPSLVSQCRAGALLE